MRRHLLAYPGISWLAWLALLLIPSVVLAEDVKGTVVWYLERDPGTEPYRVRYIVTPEYMRSDEGGHGEGYVLLLREEKQIYNVVPDNRTVMQLDGKGVVPNRPASLSLEVRKSTDSQAPTLAGKTGLTLELYANGALCQTTVVVPGLIDELREAFSEFQHVLAVQQARTLVSTPEEFQTPCFLATNIYESGYPLAHGLPLLEWDGKTVSKELLEYSIDVELPASLFDLPQDYHYFSPSTD